MTDPVLTDAGRAFCQRLTDELYANYGTDPHRGWKQLTALYDFDWSVGSGSRVVGRLPDRVEGRPMVDGPGAYVLKIEFGVSDFHNAIDLGNWVEATVWEQARERGVTELFAPVVDHSTDYRWLVMEEVETIGYDYPRASDRRVLDESTEQRREYEQRVATFERRLGEVGLGLGADGTGQIGVSRSGRIVALDYEHVTDESEHGQPAWIGSYDEQRGRRLMEIDIADDDIRERLRRLTSGADGTVTGYELRSRLDQWLS